MASLLRLIVAMALLLGAAVAPAQDTRRVVVGFPPGGTLDVLGRAVAQAAAEEPGAGTWVVDNQPGAGSLLAAQNVSRAKADGRTLLLAPVVVPAFMPHLYKKMSFDPLADLVPVAELGAFNFALGGRRATCRSRRWPTGWRTARPTRARPRSVRLAPARPRTSSA
jgi:tripartite-type tricarboxylate transporter receptor subunit TctC